VRLENITTLESLGFAVEKEFGGGVFGLRTKGTPTPATHHATSQSMAFSRKLDIYDFPKQ
jgi:hypothetical protein